MIFYETSRNPHSRRKKVFIPPGTALITPSGSRVPPAWTEVWMTTDPHSPIQATGRDSKGRRVYLYSTEQMGRSTAANFSRLKFFAGEYQRLIKQIRRDMRHSDDALVLYLIARTGFRIGSDSETKATVKAFGASTLQCSHVSTEGNTISFDFIGKKGIRFTKTIKDAFLARTIDARCADGSRPEIFSTTDDKIRAYLSSIATGSGFVVKDFRTYFGTLGAFRKIRTMPVPKNEREFKTFRKSVAQTVAAELGNSPTIALKSYISPEVFCAWETGTSLKKEKPRGKHSSLTDDFLECIHYDEKGKTEIL